MTMTIMMIESHKRRLPLLIALLSALVLQGMPASAQTSRNEVIGDVVITDKSECAVMRVEFNIPVKYTKHFPEGAGKELRIYFDPLTVTEEERRQVMRNEYFSPPDSDIVTVTEIIYEGDDVVEPYLSILFEHPMKFAVKQGGDFRSLIISVYLPDARNGCDP